MSYEEDDGAPEVVEKKPQQRQRQRQHDEKADQSSDDGEASAHLSVTTTVTPEVGNGSQTRTVTREGEGDVPRQKRIKGRDNEAVAEKTRHSRSQHSDPSEADSSHSSRSSRSGSRGSTSQEEAAAREPDSRSTSSPVEGDDDHDNSGENHHQQQQQRPHEKEKKKLKKKGSASKRASHGKRGKLKDTLGLDDVNMEEETPPPRGPNSANRGKKKTLKPLKPLTEGPSSGRGSSNSSAKKRDEVPTHLKFHGFPRPTFYINGDKNFAGKQIMFDSRATPTLERFLDRVTSLLKPPFGAVMRLYDAVSFDPITTIEGIYMHDNIVAVGRQGLKRLQYTDIMTFEQRQRSYVAPRLSRTKTQVSAQSKFMAREKTITIQALINGDEDGIGTRIVLRKSDLASWEKVLEEITTRMQARLLHGAVMWLYTLEGTELTKVSDLHDDLAVVAVDKLPLKLPPFSYANGEFHRKETKKTKLRILPKLEPRKAPKGNVVLAAFGRTGAGRIAPKDPSSTGDATAADRQSPTKALSKALGTSPGRRGSHAAVDQSRRRSKDGVLAEGDGLADDAQHHEEQMHRYKYPSITINHLDSAEDAMQAVEMVVEALSNSRRLNADMVDHALTSMQAAVREKIFEHRRQAPNITTVYDDRIEEIINFVFNPTQANVTSQDIASKFEPMVQAALCGKLAHWESTPSSFVALIVLLDQFPRTIYQDTPDMYSGDHLVKKVVLRGLNNSAVMDDLHPVYRLFPCIALSHQEDAEMQALCEAEWDKAREFFEEDDPIREYSLRFQHNRTVIEAFGRFPDRNRILHRQSTAAEIHYLQANAELYGDYDEQQQKHQQASPQDPYEAQNGSIGRLSLYGAHGQ